ncbi:MAG: shikimate kinase AroK [Gammaproteobacteria bacterium]
MKGPENIFLIGPMGSGKSTVGRALARRLDKAFFDSDQVIEERTGVRVSVIFEIEGEQGFRRREKTVIDDLTLRKDIVLATGGGSILDAENRGHLLSRGFVVYLKAPVEQLFERSNRDRNRPLLQTEHPRETLEALVRERDPLYRSTADLIISTDDRTVKQVVDEIDRCCGFA